MTADRFGIASLKGQKSQSWASSLLAPKLPPGDLALGLGDLILPQPPQNMSPDLTLPFGCMDPNNLSSKMSINSGPLTFEAPLLLFQALNPSPPAIPLSMMAQSHIRHQDNIGVQCSKSVL